MSAVLEAIAEERRTVLQLCSQMPDSMWAKDSGCSGWSVQDLVSHMACSFWLAVDPSALPDPGDLPAERAADIYVESRRSMTPRGRGRLRIGERAGSRGARRRRRSGRRHSDRRCRHLSGVGRADNLRLRSLRPHPVRPFPPDGPLQGAPPPVDQLRLAPTLDWIEAALPQQNTSLLNELQTGVELRLDGLCPRILRIGDHDDVATHITSDSQAFVRWVTQRGTWESLGVQAEGDPSTLNVIRRLRVF